MKNRRNAWIKTFGSLYKRIENCDLDNCWYCGDLRQTLDHCPPLSKIEYLDLDKFKKEGLKLLLLPCCLDCNAYLSDKALYTPEERLLFLQKKYSGLIQKFYSDWSPDEIEELGPYLKRAVIQKNKIVKVWITKLRGIEERILQLGDNPNW